MEYYDADDIHYAVHANGNYHQTLERNREVFGGEFYSKPTFAKLKWDNYDDETILNMSYNSLHELICIIQFFVVRSNMTYKDPNGVPILPRVCSVVRRIQQYLLLFHTNSLHNNEESSAMGYLLDCLYRIIRNEKFNKEYCTIYPPSDDDDPESEPTTEPDHTDCDEETKSSVDLDPTDGQTAPCVPGETTTLTADDYPFRLIGFSSEREAERFVSTNRRFVNTTYIAKVRRTLEEYGVPISSIGTVLAVLASEKAVMDKIFATS